MINYTKRSRLPLINYTDINCRGRVKTHCHKTLDPVKIFNRASPLANYWMKNSIKTLLTASKRSPYYLSVNVLNSVQYTILRRRQASARWARTRYKLIIYINIMLGLWCSGGKKKKKKKKQNTKQKKNTILQKYIYIYK